MPCRLEIDDEAALDAAVGAFWAGGAEAAALHTRAGHDARASGVSLLLAFGRGAAHFRSPGKLLAALHEHLRPGMRVPFKGSRCMQIDQLIEALSVAPPG